MIPDIIPNDLPINYDNLITTGGLIICGIIAATSGIIIALVNKTRVHAKKTREQTENSHKNTPLPNLRDNIDVNQYIVVELLTDIRNTVKQHTIDIGNITSRLDIHENNIDELTHETLPKDI